MSNPMDALLSLQPAIDSGLVLMEPCELHDDLRVLDDYPNGELRVTYALIVDGVVQAIAQFIPAEPIDGIPCLALGVAVVQSAQGRGVGTETASKALKEIRRRLRRERVSRFYVEAVVGATNEPSKKLSARLLSKHPKACEDSVSGEPAYQYIKLFRS